MTQKLTRMDFPPIGSFIVKEEFPNSIWVIQDYLKNKKINLTFNNGNRGWAQEKKKNKKAKWFWSVKLYNLNSNSFHWHKQQSISMFRLL